MTFLSDDVLFCMEKIGFGQFWKRKGLTFPVTRALTSYTHVAYSHYHQKPNKLVWGCFLIDNPRIKFRFSELFFSVQTIC